MEDFGINSRLREWMELKRFSSKDLAAWTGISRSAVSQIMRDKMNLSVETLIKVFKANPELNASWLLLGTGEKGTVDLNTAERLKEIGDQSEARNKNLLKELGLARTLFEEHRQSLERLLTAKEEIIEMLKKQLNG